MHRLASFDVADHAKTPAARLALQLGFGAGCGAAMIGARELVNLWAPHSGPFAMVYPAVLPSCSRLSMDTGRRAW